MENQYPTIQDKGTLIQLSASFGGGKKVHKEATKELHEKHSVKKKNRAKVIVDMFDSPLLDGARKCSQQARNYLKSMTIPWGDGGERWLPNSIESEVKSRLNLMIKDIEETMTKHFDKWDLWEQRWKDEGGSLSDGSFPSKEDAMSKFSIHWEVGMCIDPNDIRIGGMSKEDSERFAAEVKASEASRTRAAVRNVADQIEVVLTDMVKVGDYFTDSTGKKQNVFRDSRIERTKDLANLLEHFNITDDPEIENIRQRLLTEVCTVDADTLRESKAARRMVANSASDMLSRIGHIGKVKKD